MEFIQNTQTVFTFFQMFNTENFPTRLCMKYGFKEPIASSRGPTPSYPFRMPRFDNKNIRYDFWLFFFCLQTPRSNSLEQTDPSYYSDMKNHVSFSFVITYSLWHTQTVGQMWS